jgi:hypothetical protein
VYYRYTYSDTVHGHKSGSSHARAVRSGSPPQPSFFDNLDGTVTDTTTGLIWQKCSYGQEWDNNQKVCTGSPVTVTWKQALDAAETLTWAGHEDWRLPNLNELQTLVDYTHNDPAVNPIFAADTSSSEYWSSSPASPRLVYFVHFFSGRTNSAGDTASSYSVRAVRSGHSFVGAYGSLTITIEPEAARHAGAQWRRIGTTTWLDSGVEETNVPVGTYVVEFKIIPGWLKPSDTALTVLEDQTAFETAVYNISFSLRTLPFLPLLLDDR